ncbi:MAG: cysteine desulfurase [Bacteroidales bacterium]|nr:cysteine desulfurase [Bacteroidales bacterium]
MDIQAIRKEFPILSQQVNGYPYIYFDNGATTQKPKVVLDTIQTLYSQQNSNIHRGAHHFSNLLTDKFEQARITIQNFINAEHHYEIIFTSGTTASINLVATSFGNTFLNAGDEIIIGQFEHHSNIVPWQMIAERKNAKIKVLPGLPNGEMDISALKNLITEKTKLIAVAQVSNSTGVIHPVKEIIRIAHQYDIPVLVDAAQSIQHLPIDVRDLDADFLAFSGHKIYGPTGIGILYGKEKWLDKMQPYMGGGEMINKVSFEKTTYNKLPFKFEAGTPHYVGGIGLAEAIKFIQGISLNEIEKHEKELYHYALEKISEINNLKIITDTPHKTSVISFVHPQIPSSDIGTLLDKFGIAIRTGHHCAQPTMDFFGITGTARVSLALYNTREEIDFFVDKFHQIEKLFV